MRSIRHQRQAFTLLELLISLAIVAVLVGLLLPVLAGTRRLAHRSICANNLRQIGLAWHAYMQETEQLPQHHAGTEWGQPEWAYGGVRFVGSEHTAIADAARPINAYLDSGAAAEDVRALEVFEDFADIGITRRGEPMRSILPDGSNCYETFGTSYRANRLLLDSTAAGIDRLERPLKVAEITAQPSRLLLVGDPVWYFAVQPEGSEDRALDARWHDPKEPAGNMVAFDGSVRWVVFGPVPHPDFMIAPRPELASRQR